MLYRKIDRKLVEWKNDSHRKPIIIKGCRQCGKTSSVLEFAKREYENVAYINFFESQHYKDIFAESLAVDHLVMLMSAILGDSCRFEPHKTVIILDELQECPNARASLKFFSMDGRYDVICTGSLLGIKGYRNEPVSIPVGYETVIDMYPMDFEEFLLAKGISSDIIDMLRGALDRQKPVPDALHGRMRQLLLEYVVVGGMPAVVQKYVETSQIGVVATMQRDIVRSYEDDMVKYADDADKSKITECFKSIPVQLGKENKKFQYSLIRKRGSKSQFAGSLQWLEDTGIISRCYGLYVTELPLDGNYDPDTFKVYMADTGLFISMLEEGTAFDVLRGNLYAYKGAIFENLIADFFGKMGRRLYYYRRDSGLELDFVMRYRGECVPVEVKAVTGNAKSLKTVMAHPEKYHVKNAIKLGDYNVGISNGILTLPLYMGFLLDEV